MSRVGEKPWWSEVVGGGLVNILAGVLLLRFFKDGWMIFGSALVVAGLTILFFRGMHLRKDENDADEKATVAVAPPAPASPVVFGPNNGVNNTGTMIVHGNLTINATPVPSDGDGKTTITKPTTKRRRSKVSDAGTKTGSVNVVGNTGPTQVNIGSPGSTQVVNQRKVLQKDGIKAVWEQRDGKWVLRLTFGLTDGIWNAGESLWVQLEFDGPYESAKFVSGLPNALTEVTVTDPAKAGPLGRYELKTSTPPRANEPLVLEVVSQNKISVRDLRASPSE